MQIESHFIQNIGLPTERHFNLLGLKMKIEASERITFPRELECFSENQQSDVYSIKWYDAESLGWDKHIGKSADASCHQSPNPNGTLIQQRDFVAFESGKNYQLVTNTDISDGIFNFLRWFVPPRLLEQKKMVIHSSCVIDVDDQATLCLGPSGAGKTTISSFANAEQVLGDDLNIIKIQDGEIWATPCPLGQRIQNHDLFGKWFRVKSLFWLDKGSEVKISKISQASQYVHLLESAANMDWPNLEAAKVEEIQGTLLDMLKIQPINLLSFPMERTVWKQIREKQ